MVAVTRQEYTKFVDWAVAFGVEPSLVTHARKLDSAGGNSF